MSGYEKRAIPEALDEAINGAINDLEMLAHWRDLVTGDKIETVHARRIASAAHDALSKAWNDAALQEAPAEFIDPNSRNFKEGFSVGQIVGRDQVRSQYPPCLQCGAETASQAETMCCMAGDEDNCHGCELWTEDERINSTNPAVANDVVYADADALIAHLDELLDDNGQGGDKWDPAQAAIAGIRAWQRGSEAAVKRVADALSAQGWATGGDPDEFLDDVRAAMTLALALPQDQEAPAVVDEAPTTLTLSGYQLRQALAFIAPDEPDPEQMECEVTIAHFTKDGVDSDGNEVSAGLYCFVTDYPEEGSVLLSWDENTPGVAALARPQGREAHTHFVPLAHKGPIDFPAHQCPAESAAVWNACCMEHASASSGRAPLLSSQVPESQAADLEQFREAVELWKLEAEIAGMGLEIPDERIAEANRLLALIDAQSAKGDGDAS